MAREKKVILKIIVPSKIKYSPSLYLFNFLLIAACLCCRVLYARDNHLTRRRLCFNFRFGIAKECFNLTMEHKRYILSHI